MDSKENVYCYSKRDPALSGGAIVLDKPPVLGRPTNLDKSRARAYCAYSRCGWGLFWTFFSHLSFLCFFSLSLGDGPILTEILSRRAVKPKTTNQQSYWFKQYFIHEERHVKTAYIHVQLQCRDLKTSKIIISIIS